MTFAEHSFRPVLFAREVDALVLQAVARARDVLAVPQVTVMLHREPTRLQAAELRALGCDHVLDGDVRTVDAAQIRETLHPELRERTGWYLQQFLKLEAPFHFGQDLFILDGDALLMRAPLAPGVLRTVPHAPRAWDGVISALGIKADPEMRCFVCEQMYLSLDAATKFKARIGSHTGRDLLAAVIAAVNDDYGRRAHDDLAPLDRFSEFQAIGRFRLEIGDAKDVVPLNHVRWFYRTGYSSITWSSMDEMEMCVIER